ncbi:hypothetical protein [Massilia sp. ST3]|uniref:hypothetical protein n=1 Tax=Massilia sp. ST3 TaxID=2824903 RepID=UPI001B82AF9D|nr:hypothetical protein [Massilia sp. ST3]MBQ5947176.1 hypothetical protein [Massilia sp. ST3]
MNQPSPFDASIPVLTEVVAEPAAPAPPPVQEDSAEQLERRAVERWTGEEWSVLERRVTERILAQLQGRIDFVIEQRLRDGIAAAVAGALDGFTGQIRANLEQTIGEVVTQAVAQEISHLQTLGR